MIEKISEEWYEKMYDVLISCAGASKYEKEAFTKQMQERELSEWRFEGKLKAGGRLLINERSWQVTCYSDDVTPTRRTVVAKTNFELRKLYKKYTEPVEETEAKDD